MQFSGKPSAALDSAIRHGQVRIYAVYLLGTQQLNGVPCCVMIVDQRLDSVRDMLGKGGVSVDTLMNLDPCGQPVSACLCSELRLAAVPISNILPLIRRGWPPAADVLESFTPNPDYYYALCFNSGALNVLTLPCGPIEV